MRLRGLDDIATRRNVGLTLGQCRIELAFAQIVILRHFHDHEPVFATHGDHGFRLVRQGFLDGGDSPGLEVVCGQG